jgi:hypothetical protein
MELSAIFLSISMIFGFITPYIGIVSIFKGEYKPQRITRLVLFIITLLFVFTLYFQGDRTALYLALLQAIGGVLIFILSFKYGVGGFDKTDIVVLFLALSAIVGWKMTNDPTVGLYLSILADFIGFIPTIIKSWKEPFTEDWKFYTSDIFAASFSLLAITTFEIKDLAFSMYILFINLLIAILIVFRRNFITNLKLKTNNLTN